MDSSDIKVIEKLKAVSKQVVIVVVSGRPLIMTDKIASVDAVVAAWLPGSEGSGVADVIFGDKPFTAKLPLNWPLNIKQDTALYLRGFGL